MNKCRFSIITPFFNASKTLNQCKHSVLGQSYPDWEWLLIDDGSTDDSISFLYSFAKDDERIKIFSQENSGPSCARNVGLNNAQGEYVLFLDADDFFASSSALSTLEQYIVAHPDCDVFYFQGNVLLENGELYHDAYDYHVYESGLECLEEHCCQSKCIVFGAIYAQCYRRSMLNDNNITFPVDIYYGEDRLFTCKSFIYAKQTVVIPETLYTYVVTQGSLMHDSVRQKRKAEDNKRLAYRLDSLAQTEKRTCPKLKKYIHGIYLGALVNIHRREIDVRLMFRNASTWKLLVKDILFLLRLYKYHSE